MNVAADEKTEKATPKRRQDERKKGNVFQSNDMAAVCSLLVLFNALNLLAPTIYRKLSLAFQLFFSYAADASPLKAEDMFDKTSKAALLFAQAALPLLFISMITAIAITFLQTRLAFSLEVLKFKGERISLLKGFKRMFSVRSVVELIKAVIKITVLGWVIYTYIKGRAYGFVRLMDGSVEAAFAYIGETAVSLVNTVGAAFIFLGAFDFLYQWWEYEKNLRMSKQEIKDEYKQIEGDPQIKGRIREKQRQMASMRMMQNVPKADVIIRNPTHFAVALGYDSEANRAPVVLAKGADHLALRIVEAGEANGVYILEDKPLARGLYAAVEVDMEIPEEFYQTVAKVLAFVYKLKKKDI